MSSSVRATLPGRLLPWAVGPAAGISALGPALGPGYVLRYDMVFVPNLSARTALEGADGFPRAVPSDVVVGGLSALLPGDLVQSLLLLGIFVVGGAGACRLLLRSLGGPGPVSVPVLVGAAAGGVAFVWNPFVAERLLLGQWALLLGYAGLPWVVAAVAPSPSRRPLAGLAGMVCALVPAAVGGFSSAVITGLTAGPVALVGPMRRWWARVLLLGAALVLVSLPWLLPSLTAGAKTDPAGVEAFAPRADTPFGVVASLLTLGGVWNSGAVPPGHGEPVTFVVRLLLCVAAIAAWAWWLSRRDRPTFGVGLTVAATVGLGIALLGVTETGRELLAGLIGLWPGFGPLRDGQLYVAPLGLVQALGWGFVVHRIAGGGVDRPEPLRTGAGVFVVLLPVMVLPGLLWGVGGRLAPAQYPDEWLRAQEIVAADERPGDVLVLPWSAYRSVEWSGKETIVLDPATKLFDRRVLWNDDLSVGTPDGDTLVVKGEDARAREVEQVLVPDPRTGLPTRLEGAAEALGGLGVRYVVVSAQVDNQFWSEEGEFSVVLEAEGLTVLRTPDQHINAGNPGTMGLEVTGGLVTVGAIVWSVARSGSSLVFQCFGLTVGRNTRKEIPK